MALRFKAATALKALKPHAEFERVCCSTPVVTRRLVVGVEWCGTGAGGVVEAKVVWGW